MGGLLNCKAYWDTFLKEKVKLGMYSYATVQETCKYFVFPRTDSSMLQIGLSAGLDKSAASIRQFGRNGP